MKMKIVEKRKIYYIVSVSAICLGILFMLYNSLITKQGLFNFGIEFKGGTVLTVDIGKEFLKTDVSEIVYGITKDKNSQIQVVNNENENKVIIKLVAEDEKEVVNEDGEGVDETSTELTVAEEVISTEVSEITEENNDNTQIIDNILANAKESDTKVNLVYEALKTKYQLDDTSLIEMSNISSTVGNEMAGDAILSTLLAAAAILLYVSFRFNDHKMGIAAIIALLHDVLCVLAIYAIFRLPMGNSFIAAILTIVGYSINNTIVIFDRVRENSRGNIRQHKDLLVDRSVSDTLTRTINTSLTTLLSILALYFLGVDSIKEFTLPIIAGIIVGTYSSVFIAGSLWYDLIHMGKKHKKVETK